MRREKEPKRVLEIKREGGPETKNVNLPSRVIPKRSGFHYQFVVVRACCGSRWHPMSLESFLFPPSIQSGFTTELANLKHSGATVAWPQKSSSSRMNFSAVLPFITHSSMRLVEDWYQHHCIRVGVKDVNETIGCMILTQIIASFYGHHAVAFFERTSSWQPAPRTSTSHNGSLCLTPSMIAP